MWARGEVCVGGSCPLSSVCCVFSILLLLDVGEGRKGAKLDLWLTEGMSAWHACALLCAWDNVFLIRNSINLFSLLHLRDRFAATVESSHCCNFNASNQKQHHDLALDAPAEKIRRQAIYVQPELLIEIFKVCVCVCVCV